MKETEVLRAFVAQLRELGVKKSAEILTQELQHPVTKALRNGVDKYKGFYGSQGDDVIVPLTLAVTRIDKEFIGRVAVQNTKAPIAVIRYVEE